jgi:hypothetical protein
VIDADPFRWDATTATLDPHSAALAQAFVGYALPHGAYIAPNIAYSVVAADGSTSTYPVTTAGKPGAACMDSTIYVPVGARGSYFHDRHLTVIDRKRGRQHDLWLTSFTNGKLVGWSGGCSIPIGAVQQPAGSHCGSNASSLNGMGGVMRPEQVAAHDLAHPLVFACPQPGQVSPVTPARYPAATKVGWPYPGHLPPGSWLRFPPGLAFPAMDAASLYVCKRIQARGMFLSDQNTSDLSFKGADLGGNMASRSAWAAAGVNLGATSAAFRLSAAIPWHSLQVLAPPPHA